MNMVYMLARSHSVTRCLERLPGVGIPKVIQVFFVIPRNEHSHLKRDMHLLASRTIFISALRHVDATFFQYILFKIMFFRSTSCRVVKLAFNLDC